MPVTLDGQKWGISFSGAGVINGCEPPYGCWKLNPGPTEEQRALSC